MDGVDLLQDDHARIVSDPSRSVGAGAGSSARSWLVLRGGVVHPWSLRIPMHTQWPGPRRPAMAAAGSDMALHRWQQGFMKGAQHPSDELSGTEQQGGGPPSPGRCSGPAPGVRSGLRGPRAAAPPASARNTISRMRGYLLLSCSILGLLRRERRYRPDTGNRLCGHLPLPSQGSQPRPAASLEASCTAVMQRWARRLASSWPWARST